MKILSFFSNKNFLYALLSGILLGFAFPPFKSGYIVYFALIPLLFLNDNALKRKEYFSYNYLAFLIFHIISMYWVGGWGAKIDIFMVIGSIVAIILNPLFYVAVMGVYVLIKNRINRNLAFFTLPFLWVSIEYLRSVGDLATPWLTLGNCLTYNLALIQCVEIIGVFGLSFLIVTINILLFVSLINLRDRHYRFSLNKIAIVLIILLIQFIYGKIIINEGFYSGKEVKVGLVQPNLDPWDKWEAGSLDQQIEIYLSLSDSCRKEGAELIIWPESALPVFLLSGNYYEHQQKIQNFVDKNKIYILTGMPLLKRYSVNDKIPDDAKRSEIDTSLYYTTYNGAVLFEPGKFISQTYEKMRLVPFSERTPYLDILPFLGDFIKWGVGISNWNVGNTQTIFSYPDINEDSIRFAALICFESIFPAFVSDFTEKGANFLTVITNDSWFGKYSGPEQHKQYAILRAIENRRWIARAANGGYSCFIDPFGKVLQQTEMFTRTYVVGSVFLEDNITLYVKHKDIICYISLIISVLFIIILIIIKIKRKKNANN